MERRRPPSEEKKLLSVREELAGIAGVPSLPFREVQSHVGQFANERPLIKEHNTPLRIAEWLQKESGELLAEMHWGEGDPEPEHVERIEGELADVVIFSLTMGETLGIDVEQAVLKKTAKNHERFPKHLFQDSTADFEQIYHQRKVELGERRAEPVKMEPNIPIRLLQERDDWKQRTGQ